MNDCKLNPLISQLLNNKDATKSFDDVISLVCVTDRQIFISDIEDDLGSTISTMITFWNLVDNENQTPIEERTPIKLYIYSHGGSLDASLAIIDAITLSTTPVYTINMGMCYSAAFNIFIAGHKRFTYPLSSFLWHEGSIALSQIDANKFRNYSKFYEEQLNVLEQQLYKYTNITKEMCDEHHKDDWWINAEEALKLGICDEILTSFVLQGE